VQNLRDGFEGACRDIDVVMEVDVDVGGDRGVMGNSRTREKEIGKDAVGTAVASGSKITRRKSCGGRG